MLVRIERVMPAEEYIALTDDAVARGMYRNDLRVLLPGMAWFTPWVYDPTGERQSRGEHVMIKERPADPNASFLSPHYWRDSADKRAPMAVVCPDGSVWEIDRRSSNGDGWQVTGEMPRITCAPSIVADRYHGFLQDGAFTPDLEGRSY